MQIECYNMEKYYTGTLQLVGTKKYADIEAIQIGLPSGKIRMKENFPFTHFLMTLDGTQWVCAVNSKIAVGRDVWELTYTVDFVKDFYLKHKSDVLCPMLMRTTDSTKVSPFIPDDKMVFNGNYYLHTATGKTVAEPAAIFVSCAGGLAGTKTLGSTPVKVSSQLEIRARIIDMVQEVDFFNSITAVYACPNYDFGGDAIGGIPYAHVVTNNNTYDVEFAYKGSSGVALIGNNMVEVDTGIVLSYSSWLDTKGKSYMLYVPYIGNVQLDPTITNGFLKVTYMLDPYGGTIKAFFNGNRATMTQSVPLPQYATVTTDVGRTIRQLNNSNTASNTGIIANTVTGAGMGAVMGGGVGALIGGAIGGATSLFTNRMNFESNIKNASIGALSSVGSSGGEPLSQNQFILTILTYNLATTENDVAKAFGKVSQKIVEKLEELGNRSFHWLDVSQCRFTGPMWYVDGVRNAYQMTRIYMNEVPD